MRYQWDPEKNAINVRKHGVDFRDAVLVFDDPDRFEDDETEDEYREERWAVYGRIDRSRLTVLVVIFTDRPPDIRRIISARKADQRDADRYHHGVDRTR